MHIFFKANVNENDNDSSIRSVNQINIPYIIHGGKKKRKETGISDHYQLSAIKILHNNIDHNKGDERLLQSSLLLDIKKMLVLYVTNFITW